MAGESFAEVLDRIEFLARRVGQAPSDEPVSLTRDELIDVLDLLHRLGSAMLVLQELGRFR